jgi:hypothetical protein
MNTQPEALRLAEEADNGEWIAGTHRWREAAADELRRLHEVNQELVEVLKAFDVAAKESQTIIGFAGRSLKLLTQARAALAKATGENT